MNPWSALLESLHSALVDELTERLPDPKPELGLPTRKPGFELPATELGSSVCVSVDFGSPPVGCAAIHLSAEASKKLRLDATGLWAEIGKRATAEFSHRGIEPRFGQPLPVGANGALPTGLHEPQRMVWIPFRIGGDSLFLGLGV